MKIVQIITLGEQGGAQSHLLTLVKNLREQFELIVLIGNSGEYLSQQLIKLGIPTRTLNNLGRAINPAMDWAALTELVGVLNQLKPDLVHCHSSKAGIIGRIAAYLNGIPVVFTAHGWAFHPSVKPVQRFIAAFSEIICSHLSSLIICVSEFDRKLAEFIPLFRKEKLITILNGLPDTQHKPSIIKNNCRVQVGMLGRFAEPKRQDLLIESWREGDFDRKADLYFFGGGENLAKMRQLSNKLGCKSVFFEGEVNDVETRLIKLDIAVLLSDREGLPISIIEAMRAGLPVIASDVGGVSELIEQGKQGILIHNNSPQQVIAALNQLIDDSYMRVKLGNAGRAKFLKLFTEETMCKHIANVYLTWGKCKGLQGSPNR